MCIDKHVDGEEGTVERLGAIGRQVMFLNCDKPVPVQCLVCLPEDVKVFVSRK